MAENEARVGMRLKCATCGSEAIITKLGEPVLMCCGAPLEPATAPGAAAPPRS